MGKYRILILLIVSIFCMVGCIGEEKVAVPKFVIEVALTEEASEKLKQSGESIKGTIFFDGNGTPLPGVKTAPFRDVFLGKYDFELGKEENITIENASISKEAFSRLKDKNYYYLVNIYSGRRVFKNNILNCGYADGRFQNLKSGKEIKIVCGLL